MDFDITFHHSSPHNHSNIGERRSSQQGVRSPTTSLTTEAFKPQDKDVSVKEASIVERAISLRDADDIRLAELGYKSEFRREFSLFETIAFAFSIMAVVASVSSTVQFGLINGGHVGLVFGWLIPSVFVMTVALSLAELTSSMP
ncbi:hypothetical protein C0992_013238, partial [Termitomyces sp. T32_za158]